MSEKIANGQFRGVGDFALALKRRVHQADQPARHDRETSVRIALGALRLLNRGVPPEVAEGGPPSTNEMANALCDNNLHRAIELDPHFARPYVGLLELVAREIVPGVKYLQEDNLR